MECPQNVWHDLDYGILLIVISILLVAAFLLLILFFHADILTKSDWDPLFRARQSCCSQVARMLQARPGRYGKHEQEENSRNLGTAIRPSLVRKGDRGDRRHSWPLFGA